MDDWKEHNFLPYEEIVTSCKPKTTIPKTEPLIIYRKWYEMIDPLKKEDQSNL